MATPPIPPSQPGFNNNNSGTPLPPPPPGFPHDPQKPAQAPKSAYTAPQPKQEMPEQDHSRTRIIGADDRSYSQYASSGSGNTFKIIIIAAVALIVIGLGIAAYFLWLDSSSTKEDKYNYNKESEQPITEIEEIPVEQEIPAESPSTERVEPATPAPSPRHTSGVWKEGRNVLIGTFNYGGSKYGFTVTLDYSTSTGRATNATYEAHGYGSASPLSMATISSDGTVINLRGTASGSATEINVHASEGGHTFTGTMLRGDHQGSCTLTLQ